MVSSRSPTFRASLARIAGAGGAAIIESELDGEYSGHEQHLRPGSYIVVDPTPLLQEGTGFTLEAWVWPCALGTPQAIVGRFDGLRGFALGLDELGGAALWLGGADAVAVAATGMPLRRRAWHKVVASYNPASGIARIAQEPREHWPNDGGPAAAEIRTEPWLEAAAPFMIAAWGAPPRAHFNGKLEAPRLIDATGMTLAAWDLGSDFAGDAVADTSGHGCHGRCVNLPMRAVTGHTWSGAVTDPALDPDRVRSHLVPRRRPRRR